jgi:hypothetical protein
MERRKCMSNKTEKKIRRSIRKKVNDISMLTLRKEIIRLARNRDILGLTLILESLAFLIFIIITLR